MKTAGPRADAGHRTGAGRSGKPGHGPNLRASCCRRLEDAGWLRTLRAPDLQLAVEG